MAVLSRRLDRISEQHRWSRDFTLNSLGAALQEVIACFPVYRSYVRPESGNVNDADRHHILSAIRGAKQRNPTMSESIFDFVASVLLLDHPVRTKRGRTRRARRFRAAVSATHRAGDGEGFRGHRAVSLLSARIVE